VSQLSAANVKPSGIESGVALRTLQDVESGRHAMNAKRWDSLFKQVTKLVIRTAADIYGKKGKYTTKFAAKDHIESIDWGDVQMEDDRFEIQIFPTNMLPETPAGRLETVERLIQGGFVTPEQGLALLEFPDLEQFESLATASRDDIDRQIGNMENGEEEKPEPYQDLNMGMRRVTSALQRAKNAGAPESVLELFQAWIDAASEILELRRQEQMMEQQQMMMAGQPPQE